MSVCIAYPQHAGDDDQKVQLEEEEGIEEDDGDEFAAMQTQVVMLGRVGGADRLEDDFDGASFIQAEAETLSKKERSCGSGFQVLDEVDDALSLMQTDAAMHSPKEMRETDDDDKLSLMQQDITEGSEKVKTVDRSKILAWDTILAMDVNTEKDEVKKMGKTLQKETSVSRSLTSEIDEVNMLLVEPDEGPTNVAASREKFQGNDETFLLQEDARTEKRCEKQAKKNARKAKTPLALVGDETSFMQTTITLSKGPRRVGRNMPDAHDEDDLASDDSIAFMQASVNLEQGCSRTNRYVEDEDDEDDVFAL